MKESKLTPSQVQELISWYEDIFLDLEETKDFSNTLFSLYQSHLEGLRGSMSDPEKNRVLSFMGHLTHLFVLK